MATGKRFGLTTQGISTENVFKLVVENMRDVKENFQQLTDIIDATETKDIQNSQAIRNLLRKVEDLRTDSIEALRLLDEAKGKGGNP